MGRYNEIFYGLCIILLVLRTTKEPVLAWERPSVIVIFINKLQLNRYRTPVTDTASFLQSGVWQRSAPITVNTAERAGKRQCFNQNANLWCSITSVVTAAGIINCDRNPRNGGLLDSINKTLRSVYFGPENLCFFYPWWFDGVVRTPNRSCAHYPLPLSTDTLRRGDAELSSGQYTAA